MGHGGGGGGGGAWRASGIFENGRVRAGKPERK